MPETSYEVIVGTTETEDPQHAIAYASRALAYGDHTDTYAFSGLFDIVVTEGGPQTPISVALHFTATFDSEDARAAFEDELDALNSVETFERVAFEPVI